MRRGEYRTALRQIHALDQDDAFPPERRAALYLLAVRAEANLRHVHAAAKWADRAVEAAELWGSWEDVGAARRHAGAIYRDLGDTARALQWLHLFLAHRDRYPGQQGAAGIVYYNLGLVHRMRREVPEALAAYDQAIQHLQTEPAALLAAHHNKAWLLLLEDRPADAAAHIAAAGDLVPEGSPPDQAMHLCLRALWLQRLGKVATSVALCEEVLGRQDLPPLPMGQAAWIAAANALQVSSFDQARAFVDAGLGYALEAREPTLLNALNDVKRRLRALAALAGQSGPAAT